MNGLSIKLTQCYYIFFYFLISELFLCGSGQILKFGPLTLRMFNFGIALLFSLIIAIKHKIPKKTNLYFIFFTYYLVCWGAASIIFNDYKFVLEDLKPLGYFFLFYFVYYMIIECNTIDVTIKILKFSTLFLSVIYLIYVILIKCGIVDFSVIYLFAGEMSDITFRTENGELFYKGFIFLPIGFLFFWNERKYLYSIILLVAIYFTQTRGFYIITIFGLFLYYCFTYKMKLSNIFIGLFSLIIILFLIDYFGLFEVNERRDDGDMIRILTFQQVIDNMTPFSVIFGHGFGKGVPIREVHMEMSYLEIFHKQGIIGLFMLAYLFFKIYVFWKGVLTSNKQISTLFFIGTCMIYFQSFFNPYINNPMGIGFILLSYFICFKLSKYYENPMCVSVV